MSTQEIWDSLNEAQRDLLVEASRSTGGLVHPGRGAPSARVLERRGLGDVMAPAQLAPEYRAPTAFVINRLGLEVALVRGELLQ